MEALNIRLTIPRSEIATDANGTQVPVFPVNWLASQANRAASCAHETVFVPFPASLIGLFRLRVLHAGIKRPHGKCEHA